MTNEIVRMGPLNCFVEPDLFFVFLGGWNFFLMGRYD